MNLQRLVAPAPAVSLALAKQHLRVDHDDDDALIESLVAGAVEYLDGWTGVLGRAIEPQTWSMALDAFPLAEIRLPLGPVQGGSVLVRYLDDAGILQTVSSAAYTVDATSSVEAWVVPAADFAWPPSMAAVNAVRVQWVAGLGATENDRQMILQLVASGYQNREATGPAATELPFGVRARAFARRVWSF